MDGEGAPVKGEFVRESWKHYSFETDAADSSDDRWSDEDGYVVFPERTIRVTLARRAVVPLLNALRLQEHASSGPRADIMVWGGGTLPSVVKYQRDKPLPTHITLP